MVKWEKKSEVEFVVELLDNLVVREVELVGEFVKLVIRFTELDFVVTIFNPVGRRVDWAVLWENLVVEGVSFIAVEVE